jgi:CRISPR-associated protein Cas1
MQLYLDSYGAYLNVSNGMFQVKPKNYEAHRFSPDDVDVIFVTEGVTLTTDAMMLALDYDIPILVLDYLGQPVGQVWSGKFGSIATIRRNQLRFAETHQGWQWMAQTLGQKVAHQMALLKALPERYPHLFDTNALARQGRNCAVLDGLSKELMRMDFKQQPIDTKLLGNQLRAREATASRHYFRFLASIMPAEKWQFETRNYRPARDYFNCLLNYLYGMLYAQVELALVKVGIDPAIGVLHVDRYNRPPMVYDFIEPYRHWAETVAVDLAVTDALSDDDFRTTEDPSEGIWLGSKSKGVVINKFLTFLNETIIFNKKNQKRLVVLDLEAQRLAAHFKNLKF